MSEIKWPKKKLIFLLLLIGLYLVFGLTTKLLVVAGFIHPLPPKIEDTSPNNNYQVYAESVASLKEAQKFTSEKLVEENGHVNLYFTSDSEVIDKKYTNSEAVSYYIFWNALDKNKKEVNKINNYIKRYMLHPEEGYMMWKLSERDIPIDDGVNIASDADLRTIKALLIAEENWNEENHSDMIDSLAISLEKTSITSDNFLAPYAGVSNGKIWKTEEVWLSYADFETFRKLSERRGQPWRSVYNNMKSAVIKGQLPNGLYNTQLNEKREYHNSLDGGEYSINSLWVMVRAAESKDPELEQSARKSLQFYKNKYEKDKTIYTSYDAQGNRASEFTSPWVYALIARAAINLNEKEFADKMIIELLKFQEKDEESEYYGSFPEESEKVSQFTMQESILTLQSYIAKYKF